MTLCAISMILLTGFPLLSICSLDNMGVCVTTDRDCNHGSRLPSHSCLLLHYGQETREASQSLK